MRILALDLATRTGWALWDGARRESGFVDFDVKRGESPGMRFVRFNGWLDEAVIAAPRVARVYTDGEGTHMEFDRSKLIDLIVYEEAHQRGGAATEIAAGFTTRVQEFCARYKIEHASVHTATLKKWTAGKGNAGKPEMIAAVNERFGPPFVTDDNEADAIALLEYAKAELVPQEG